MGADGSGDPALRPLTEAQEGLWYFQTLDPSNPILNTGQYLDLSGPLDLPALREALAETEALQLRFAATAEGPRQWLSGALPPVAELDLRGHAEAEAEALRWMQDDSARPADLASGPVAGFALVLLPGGRVLLYQRIHHLAIDGYGMVLLTDRIGAHYGHLTGQAPAPLPFPPLSRTDEEDAAWRGSPRRAEDGAWWKAGMAGLPEVASPGTLAGERAVSGPSFHRKSLWLPMALTARLAAFSEANGLAWPEVLTGLAGAYLARWSGGETVIGMPFMARMGRRIALLPCMAMNLHPDEDAAPADWLRAAARALPFGTAAPRPRAGRRRPAALRAAGERAALRPAAGLSGAGGAAAHPRRRSGGRSDLHLPRRPAGGPSVRDRRQPGAVSGRGGGGAFRPPGGLPRCRAGGRAAGRGADSRPGGDRRAGRRGGRGPAEPSPSRWSAGLSCPSPCWPRCARVPPGCRWTPTTRPNGWPASSPWRSLWRC